MSYSSSSSLKENNETRRRVSDENTGHNANVHSRTLGDNVVASVAARSNDIDTFADTTSATQSSSSSSSSTSSFSSSLLVDSASETSVNTTAIHSTSSTTHNCNINSSSHNEVRQVKLGNNTREIETLTDICSSDNLAEVEVISLLDEKIPTYKLRADTVFSHSNCDWIRAPLYFDEQQISQLTNEQIQLTLDYFILSGYRVSQMTKTYYDIEAVTKLLDEKEKDLELAATIGKQLLERGQQLELKIEFLEAELEKTTEMVNQLRYEITLKDNLLKSFIDSEAEDLSLDDQDETIQKKKLYDINTDTLHEYKKKISYLENENETLRSKAEYFERETTDLETRESCLIENCFKELEMSQSNLKDTQEELKLKTTECYNQQEEIGNLFTQIYDLQQKIKSLTNANNDLQSNYDSCTSDLLTQINELKEKYNECLKQLSKTTDELSALRKKTPSKSAKHLLTKSTSTSFNVNTNINSNYLHANGAGLRNEAVDASLSTLVCDDDSYYDLDNYSYHSNRANKMNNNNAGLYSPWMSTNSNSFAAELFTSLARDYRAKNANLSMQASQSSDFIRKFKQKLTRQLPGSSLDTCLQSDSEAELLNCSFGASDSENVPNAHLPTTAYNARNSANYLFKFTNCPTPDSVLSTGSASIYSNLFNKSSSFTLPEKLQIVKPIEGSQTLQHWQYLATPNLGCLFENRPGISIKGGHQNGQSPTGNKKPQMSDPNNEMDDGMYDGDFDYDEFDYENPDQDDQDYEDEVDFITNPPNLRSESFYSSDVNNNNLAYNNNNNGNNHNRRMLSPSKMELLTKLLENEERHQQEQPTAEMEDETSDPVSGGSIFGFIRSISTRYFRSTSNQDEQQPNRTTTTAATTRKKSPRQEFDDPDTPPSSPINLPHNQNSDRQQQQQSTNQNILLDVFKSAKSYFNQTWQHRPEFNRSKSGSTIAPTPPGTPTHELENACDHVNQPESHTTTLQTSFFDQIVNKLNVFSSFRTVQSSDSICSVKRRPSRIVKPTAVYPVGETIKPELRVSDFDQEERELVELASKCATSGDKLCNTPPPSPSKFSPPPPELLDSDYSEEQIKKSAFVKVASLNPYLNQSSVDLASLLGTLSSLKRSQRFL